MIYAVTGAGPRTGTSWTMGKLLEAGLPVHWTEYLHIPGAKYETVEELSGLDNVIVKVWPRNLSRANISRMVVLRRDRNAQIESIENQLIREREAGLKIVQTPEQLINQCEWMLEQSQIPRREYRTEELNDAISKIIDWLAEPFIQEYRKWQQQQ